MSSIYEPYGGESLQHAANACLQRAFAGQGPVEMNFNDITLIVTKDSSWEQIVAEYYDLWYSRKTPSHVTG